MKGKHSFAWPRMKSLGGKKRWDERLGTLYFNNKNGGCVLFRGCVLFNAKPIPSEGVNRLGKAPVDRKSFCGGGQGRGGNCWQPGPAKKMKVEIRRARSLKLKTLRKEQ